MLASFLYCCFNYIDWFYPNRMAYKYHRTKLIAHSKNVARD